MKSQKKFNRIIIAFILLLIGLLVYCLFDTNILIIQALSNTSNIINIKNNLTFLLRNYAPDFLWATSLTIVVSVYTDHKAMVLFLPLLLVLSFEFSQLFNIIKGTFDVFDILVEVSGIMLIFLINLKDDQNEK